MLETGAWTTRAAHANAMAKRLAAAMPFKVMHPVDANGVFVEMDETHPAPPPRSRLVRLPLHRRHGALHVLLGDDRGERWTRWRRRCDSL